MNLTALRRLVWAADAAALLAAGGAAWYAIGADAAPRDREEWVKLFPTRKSDSSKLVNEPGPYEIYKLAATWDQGPKAVKVEATAGPVGPVAPPDPLQDVTLVSVVQSTDGMLHSSATLRKDKTTFSMRVGECIPLDPNEPKSARGPWRLDEVRAASYDPATDRTTPSEALFHHVETLETALRKSESISGGSADLGGHAGAAAAAGDGPIEHADADGVPRKDQAPVLRLVRADKEKGEYEYELPEREVNWLTHHAADEAKSIATTPVSEAEGGGFRLKSVPASSRLAASGLKAEDRVIAVNGEKVASTEQAIAVGKKQYEGGTGTFTIKVERAGKVMNFTFHAPRKKARP